MGEEGTLGSISDDEDESNKYKAKKRKLRDAREGKTVFIRNLPFDASEEEICGLFEKFGKLEYCKIVVDHIAEHSRGSAFVKFEEKPSAEECLNKCNMDDDCNGMSQHKKIMIGTIIYPNVCNLLIRQYMSPIIFKSIMHRK